MLREVVDRLLDAGHQMRGPMIVRDPNEPLWKYGVYNPSDGKLDWRTADDTPLTRTFARLDSFVEYAKDVAEPIYVGEGGATVYGNHVVEATMPLSQTEEHALLRDLKEPRTHTRFVRALHQVSALASNPSEVQAFKKVKLTKNESGEHEHKIASGQSVARSLVAEVKGEESLPESLRFTFPMYKELVDLPRDDAIFNERIMELHLHVNAEAGTLWLKPLAGAWDGLGRMILNGVVDYIKKESPDTEVLRGQAVYR